MGLTAVGFAAQGVSMILDGMAEAEGRNFDAQKSERAKEIAFVNADQVDASRRQELSVTVSNIRAIRAAAGGSPDSPSGRAYIAEQESRSDRQRRIEVGGIRMQGRQYGEDAKFYRQAAKSALIGGFVGSLGSFAKAGTAAGF